MKYAIEVSFDYFERIHPGFEKLPIHEAQLVVDKFVQSVKEWTEGDKCTTLIVFLNKITAFDVEPFIKLHQIEENSEVVISIKTKMDFEDYEINKKFTKALNKSAKKIGYDNFADLISMIGHKKLKELRHTQYELVIEKAVELFAEGYLNDIKKAKEFLSSRGLNVKSYKKLSIYDEMIPKGEVIEILDMVLRGKLDDFLIMNDKLKNKSI